jgi:hypothetical protein
LANFTIHLVKLGNASLDEGAITDRLKALFNEVITKGKVSAYQQTDVNWRQDCPASIPDDQLLVYVLSSQMDSVVTKKFKTGSQGVTGTTAWETPSGLTGSEVYASTSKGSGLVLANVIFHEFMHNKGHWSDEALHPDGGMAGGTVDDKTELNQKNIVRMARVLAARHPQWTGGCACIDDPNDPLPKQCANNSFFPNRPEALGVAAAGAAVRGGSAVPGPRGLA